MAKEYVFLHEWDVDAPQTAVFNALAHARTYPEWWKPVYIGVEGECEPTMGCTSKQHFKGKLPYTLRTTSEIVAFNPPNSFGIKVVGDLTGSGQWTLTPRDGKVHIRFDWTVFADRLLLKLLTRSPARSSASTTTGRPSAPRRGSSPTRAPRLGCSPTPELSGSP